MIYDIYMIEIKNHQVSETVSCACSQTFWLLNCSQVPTWNTNSHEEGEEEEEDKSYGVIKII